MLVADASHLTLPRLSFLVCRRGHAACLPVGMAMEDGAGLPAVRPDINRPAEAHFCIAGRFLKFPAWWGSRGQGHFREQRAALALGLTRGLFHTLPWWHQLRHGARVSMPTGNPTTDPNWNLQRWTDTYVCRHAYAQPQPQQGCGFPCAEGSLLRELYWDCPDHRPRDSQRQQFKPGTWRESVISYPASALCRRARPCLAPCLLLAVDPLEILEARAGGG